MGYDGESILDLVRDGDLDVRLSCAFILFCSQRSFLEIREMIEEYLKDRQGERYIHGTGSSKKLYIVKEEDYDLIQQIKENKRR